jgi:hypothetical protein
MRKWRVATIITLVLPLFFSTAFAKQWKWQDVGVDQYRPNTTSSVNQNEGALRSFDYIIESLEYCKNSSGELGFMDLHRQFVWVRLKEGDVFFDILFGKNAVKESIFPAWIKDKMMAGKRYSFVHDGKEYVLIFPLNFENWLTVEKNNDSSGEDAVTLK